MIYNYRIFKTVFFW